MAEEGIEEYPAAHIGMPDATATTRNVLLAATPFCDVEQLVALGLCGRPRAAKSRHLVASCMQRRDPADYERDHASLRNLALATLPFGAFEARPSIRIQRPSCRRPSTSEAWPAALTEKVSPDDVWSADRLNSVAAPNDATADQLIRDTDLFGAYTGFRGGITEVSTWR